MLLLQWSPGLAYSRLCSSSAVSWKRVGIACVWVHAKLLQLCLTLCDPMDCSPPGSSVHAILQARKPEWVAVSSFRGSSWPKNRTCISYLSSIWQAGSLPLAPPGKPRSSTVEWKMVTCGENHILNIVLRSTSISEYLFILFVQKILCYRKPSFCLSLQIRFSYLLL